MGKKHGAKGEQRWGAWSCGRCTHVRKPCKLTRFLPHHCGMGIKPRWVDGVIWNIYIWCRCFEGAGGIWKGRAAYVLLKVLLSNSLETNKLLSRPDSILKFWWFIFEQICGAVDWRLKIEDSPGLLVQVFNPNALQSLGVKMNVHVLADGMFMDR